MTKLTIAENVSLDLLRLVDSRLLIQANSGGGKSWLLRLLAEQSAAKVQVVILDPEGEFATLRERFDFLLVGQGGEIPAEPRAAGLLARRLLELQASAVIDLYALRLPDRRKFVRLFLESLMHLPKDCWHPLLVMLDEAHIFCPERSAGEAESTAAVIDLMSQGRKRSYCGVLATQRLSKLHKDAEAETNNVFIGRTWLDIDQKRAGDLLGFGKEDRHSLRDLAAGEFFAFGPALSAPGVSRLRAAQVQTTHPRAGQRHKLTPPKPSEAVRRIVADLADLPQQAEAEIRDLADAKRRVADLERQLEAKPSQAPAAAPLPPQRIEVPVVTPGQLQEVRDLVDRMEGVAGSVADAARQLAAALSRVINRPPEVKHHPVPAPQQPRPVRQPAGPVPSIGTLQLGQSGMRRMLIALAQNPNGLTKRKLSILTGMAADSGTWTKYMSNLRKAGYVASGGAGLQATDAGLAALGDYSPLPTGAGLRAYWQGELGNSGMRRIFDVLCEAYPDRVPKEAVADRSGIELDSGTWTKYLSTLRGLELIEGRGELKASDELFE